MDTSPPVRYGPKTAEGRAAVRGNAIKHGITADAIVIPDVESQEEWEAFRDRFIDAHEPGSDAERITLEDAARRRWRIRRVERMEAETIAVAREAVEQDWRSPNEEYHGYPPTLAAARSGLDRAARIAEIVEALPGMDVGHYIDPSIGDAIVECLADGEDDDVESFRGGYATATELRLAAGRIAAAQDVSVDEVYEQGLRYAAAALDEAQTIYDYVDSSVAHRRRRAGILPEATLYALSRHEAQLDRAYHRAMTQFEALKAAREGRPVPLARLQVHA